MAWQCVCVRFAYVLLVSYGKVIRGGCNGQCRMHIRNGFCCLFQACCCGFHTTILRGVRHTCPMVAPPGETMRVLMQCCVWMCLSYAIRGCVVDVLCIHYVKCCHLVFHIVRRYMLCGIHVVLMQHGQAMQGVDPRMFPFWDAICNFAWCVFLNFARLVEGLLKEL